jgi:hypothetical protein
MTGRIVALVAALVLGAGSAYAQDLTAGAGRFEIGAFPGGAMFFTETPGMWMYSGNLVVNPHGNDRALVPYATAGIGGLTMCPCGDVEALGISAYETYLTGNAGLGLKWFSTQHFGVRGDYRFFAVKNKETAPWFFGNENRYGHRVQAGLIFTY